MNMIIRSATPDDASEIRGIYDYYVTETAVSFEYDTPGEEEMRSRIENTLKKYPYLVAVKNNRIIGYAYAGAFRTRKAYRYCAELSLYLDKNERGQGIGKQLYEALNGELRSRGFRNVYACVTHTEQEDEYLTNASTRFHERQGFTLCGTFHQCGYKFGKWYDMIWMEKFL